MSLGKASKEFGIPKMTLSDKKRQRWSTNQSRRKTELTTEEEAALKSYIDYMASINHPLSIAAVKSFAWNIVKKSKRPSRFSDEKGPGHTWYLKFKKRHNLTNREPDNINRGRSRMANLNVWKEHFDLFEETVDKFLLDKSPKTYLIAMNPWLQ
jgi:hypothetical protein